MQPDVRPLRRLAVTCFLLLAVPACGTSAGVLAAPASPTSAVTTAPPLAELVVACTADSTRVTERTVAAGEQGIRIRVSGPGAGTGLYLAYYSGGQVRGGEPVPGDGSMVLVLPPGPAEVACQESLHDPVDRQPVVVVDPRGLFVRRTPPQDDLDCSNPGQASSAFSGTGATAAEAATDFAGRVQASLGPRDGGYPDQNPQEYLLVRHGRAIGTTQAFREGARSWSAAWNYVCP